jgi:hypothetical protein
VNRLCDIVTPELDQQPVPPRIQQGAFFLWSGPEPGRIRPGELLSRSEQ